MMGLNGAVSGRIRRCRGGVATLFCPICTNNRTPVAKYMTRDVLVSSAGIAVGVGER